MKKIQFYLTPSEGKRLIGKAMAALPDIRKAIEENTVLVVAGTTNAPVAYELLKLIGETEGFSHLNYYRGMTVPAGTSLKGEFMGDVVIQKGKWLRGKTIFDVADDMKNGDIIIKGANAVNVQDREAGVLLGHPKAGTALPILSAVHGRRTKLYIPVGLEKRVDAKISELTRLVNDGESEGLRMLPLSGEIITETEAFQILCGVKTVMIASGGVLGAEGGIYFMAEGTEEELEKCRELVRDVKNDRSFW